MASTCTEIIIEKTISMGTGASEESSWAVRSRDSIWHIISLPGGELSHTQTGTRKWQKPLTSRQSWRPSRPEDASLQHHIWLLSAGVQMNISCTVKQSWKVLLLLEFHSLLPTHHQLPWSRNASSQVSTSSAGTDIMKPVIFVLKSSPKCWEQASRNADIISQTSYSLQIYSEFSL